MFWRRLFRKKSLTSEIEEELTAHLAIEAQQRAERGIPNNEAEQQARRAFGNRTLAAEGAYENWGFAWLDRLSQDVRYALRSLRRKPSFTVAAVFSLALGIGATSAVFAIADAVFLRPLPYMEPSRLLWVAVRFPGNREFLASPDYVAWRRDNHIFSSLAATQAMGGEAMLLNGERAREVHSSRVSANFLRTLGIRPLLGRDFTKAEELPNGPRAVLLSYGLWQEHFGGNRNVAGRAISLDGESYTVAGVLPKNFQFPMDVPFDLLTTLPISPTASHHDQMMMTWATYGRLKPGVSVAQARADLANLFAKSTADMPAMFRKDTRLIIEPLQTHRIGDARKVLAILVAAVVALLLITCANVANLLLGRWAARAGEFAVRRSLGAGGMRLTRQLFTEAAVLTVAGALLGSMFLVTLLQVFAKYAGAELPRLAVIPIDGRVFAISLAVSVATTLLFALIPVLRTGGLSLQTGLQQFGRPGHTTGQHRFVKRGLIVIEVGLSLLLLCGAALLFETLWHLRNDHLGFLPEHATMISIPFKGTALEHRNRQQATDELAGCMRGVPGTIAVAQTECSPLSGGALTRTFNRSDKPLPGSFERGLAIHMCGVGDEFPEAAGLHMIKGRFFTQADDAHPTSFVVINQAAMRAFLPEGDPLGKQILRDVDGKWKTVIGVISDSKNAGLNAAAEPQAFVNHQAWPDAPTLDFLVRTVADPQSFRSAVSLQLRKLDPGLIATFETLDEQISTATSSARFNSVLLGTFGGLAFLMTSIGIYGVLAFAVTERTGEIGIRLALGAKPSEVLAMILREGAALVAIGLVAGSGAFWALSRYLGALLYGVRVSDSGTYVAVLVPLVAVALCVILIPARRAASVDPAAALRHT